MYSQPFRLLPLAIMFSSCAVFAQADSSADFYNLSLAELAQVDVSIATGNSTPLDRAPATASVIYAAEIAAMGAQTLNDVLETVPGLHISLSSLSRLDSVYSIRGIHTGFNPQVLLLLNGVPVQYSAQGGRPTLFRLPAISIARVEVIRGPGSAVYGADAYSGVINVITKDATAIEHTQLATSSGSFGGRELTLQSAAQWSDWMVAFTLAYQESQGDPNRRINADLQSALDAGFGTNASRAPGALATRYKVLDSHLAIQTDNLHANVWNWQSIDTGVGAGAAQALDPEGRDDSNLWMSDVTYSFNVDSDDWDNSIRASHLYYKQESKFSIFPRGALLPIGEDGNVNSAPLAGFVLFPDGLLGNPSGVVEDSQLDVVTIYHGWDSHRLRWAMGTRYQTASPREEKNFGPGVINGSVPVVDGSLTTVTNTDYVFLGDSSRRVHYLSLQDEWRIITDLDLTAGLRYDNYSDFGGTTNPRVALVWAFDPKFTAKLLYGSAFRAPSFAELYFKNNPVSLGNPSLKPEQIDSQEASLNFRATDQIQFNVTAFMYQASDMIEFIPDSEDATLRVAANARDQDGKGMEFELHWKPSTSLHIAGSYSLQDAENVDTGAAIADAPQQQLKLNAHWVLSPSWSLSSQLYWIMDRERNLGDSRPPVDDYVLLNATLHRYFIVPQLSAFLSVRNATNADAREPSSGLIPQDYPLESRSLWLGLNYIFE